MEWVEKSGKTNKERPQPRRGPTGNHDRPTSIMDRIIITHRRPATPRFVSGVFLLDLSFAVEGYMIARYSALKGNMGATDDSFSVYRRWKAKYHWPSSFKHRCLYPVNLGWHCRVNRTERRWRASTKTRSLSEVKVKYMAIDYDIFIQVLRSLRMTVGTSWIDVHVPAVSETAQCDRDSSNVELLRHDPLRRLRLFFWPPRKCSNAGRASRSSLSYSAYIQSDTKDTAPHHVRIRIEVASRVHEARTSRVDKPDRGEVENRLDDITKIVQRATNIFDCDIGHVMQELCEAHPEMFSETIYDDFVPLSAQFRSGDQAPLTPSNSDIDSFVETYTDMLLRAHPGTTLAGALTREDTKGIETMKEGGLEVSELFLFPNQHQHDDESRIFWHTGAEQLWLFVETFSGLLNGCLGVEDASTTVGFDDSGLLAGYDKVSSQREVFRPASI
ncbi:hypothetical protein FISHEDRAFT_55986 [Fistulina hepatica ATCC 64428]|uniref:Uncharacterized protein n=1 Tax=Fistulina hepatica ATCC 64428 TaxID=1128425 RepID=A0A0D7ALM8_9AGAR|nr:hypothetical protein FISHEDRAFT_55986 [Fistulina hepatica ATCC 64428]